MSARLSVCPSVSQSGPDRTVCLSVCLDLYLCQCFLLSVIRAAFIAAMPPLYPDGQAVHPVCQTAIQIGVARQDPNWRCPPSCQHCWHMGRPRIIPTTPMPMPNGPPPMAKRQLAAVATGSDASGPSKCAISMSGPNVSANWFIARACKPHATREPAASAS